MTDRMAFSGWSSTLAFAVRKARQFCSGSGAQQADLHIRRLGCLAVENCASRHPRTLLPPVAFGPYSENCFRYTICRDLLPPPHLQKHSFARL
ncbi:hypothetical protein C8J56DRAFT_1049810 [Mycena floridula]|nr:hypothetical protein C8J56DRAFT_1049810 [Mycena floridula]